jgi:hypothetical protein
MWAGNMHTAGSVHLAAWDATGGMRQSGNTHQPKPGEVSQVINKDNVKVKKAQGRQSEKNSRNRHHSHERKGNDDDVKLFTSDVIDVRQYKPATPRRYASCMRMRQVSTKPKTNHHRPDQRSTTRPKTPDRIPSQPPNTAHSRIAMQD